jgi:glycosyltransferase involved in cell wall biosynthesis
MFNITIVTACWRAENVSKVIESVNNQTFKNWHHILVNDNNPEIRKVLPELCDGVRRHWIDLGVRTHYYGALARNIGAIVAFSYVHHSKRDINNEWIVFHDDDNQWRNDHLETMIYALNTHPEATMVAADMVRVGANNPEWQQNMGCTLRHGGCDLGQFMYKTELFRKYGYFFPHPRRKQRYDWELINKITQGEGEKIIYTHEPTFIMSYRKK